MAVVVPIRDTDRRGAALSADLVMTGFSAAFSAAFSRTGYICPATAQAAIAAGAGWQAGGSELRVAGALLIGPAGKIFEFSSEETAGRWAQNAAAAYTAERGIVAAMSAKQRAAWVEKKRAKLTTAAARVVEAAGRQQDEEKRAALVAESSELLGRWADDSQ